MPYWTWVREQNKASTEIHKLVEPMYEACKACNAQGKEARIQVTWIEYQEVLEEAPGFGERRSWKDVTSRNMLRWPYHRLQWPHKPGQDFRISPTSISAGEGNACPVQELTLEFTVAR